MYIRKYFKDLQVGDEIYWRSNISDNRATVLYIEPAGGVRIEWATHRTTLDWSPHTPVNVIGVEYLAVYNAVKEGTK